MSSFLEALEMRALLSASAISTQVTIDRLTVRADLLKFESDCCQTTATLLGDCKALQMADVKQDTTLAPLFKTFHTDISAMWTQLRSDRLAESAAVLKDESVIVTELGQMLKDKGNPTAIKADRATLVGDRIQLQNDEIAGLNSRLATRQAAYTTLFNDLSNIATAVESDSGASSALKADVTKFLSDRTTTLNTLSTDLATIITARTQLVADLTALQSVV